MTQAQIPPMQPDAGWRADPEPPAAPPAPPKTTPRRPAARRWWRDAAGLSAWASLLVVVSLWLANGGATSAVRTAG